MKQLLFCLFFLMSFTANLLLGKSDNVYEQDQNKNTIVLGPFFLENLKVEKDECTVSYRITEKDHSFVTDKISVPKSWVLIKHNPKIHYTEVQLHQRISWFAASLYGGNIPLYEINLVTITCPTLKIMEAWQGKL